ncbi:MAG TPA: D-glucuronyl C5-epimerase family protein [Gaiellaceae bacterium]
MRFSLGAAIAMVGMVVFVGSAPARTALPDQKAALAGIQRGVTKGWIERADAARYRNTVNRAAKLVRGLPQARRAPLAATLHQVAQVASKLTEARARAVLEQLAVNNDYFAKHGPPARGTDITDADGIVYRYMSGQGFEFHPLANFGALNGEAKGGTTESVQRLALALIDRGVSQRGGGIGWEYYFNYSGGRAPWLSGMAQAVAAQAFANAARSDEVDSERLTAMARAAYLAIPGRLVFRRSSGPWIRLYGFNHNVVLNAQLQSLISLRDYANANADGDAAELAAAMERAVATDLRRFDTGYWTYYSLPGTPSTLDYQKYVVLLLRKLNSSDSRLNGAADRFARYAKQLPAFKIAGGDLGTVRFWLSKPATVEMRSEAGRTKRLTLFGGWYDLGWKLPTKAGAYSVLVSARDWAGNSSSFSGLPIVRVVPAAVWSVVGSSVSQKKSILDAAESGVVSHAAVATTTPSPGQASFSVGAGLDNAAQAPLAASAGLNSVRRVVTWNPGLSAPDEATLSDLRSVPVEQRLIIELSTESLPTKAVDRSALATFASSLVEQLPSIDELLLGPAVTTLSATDYSLALASLRDAVKAKSPTLLVAGMLDGAKSPYATLKALARTFSDSGRAAPLMDELAFKPAVEAAKNSWTLANYVQLVAALDRFFAGTPQMGSTLPILVDGVAKATTIPAEKVGAYPSPPGPSLGVTEKGQENAYKQVLQSTVCMPNVSGVLLDRLVDGAGSADLAGDQSGLYYADGSAKTSLSAVAASAALAERGALEVCPGLQADVAAKTLVFPLSFSSQSPPWVGLACTRDCVYLVTLERADGKPLRAKRGVLRADGAATVKLAGSATPRAGDYRLHVRLIAQVNPGAIREYLSPNISGS